jgi:uncharacterized protein
MENFLDQRAMRKANKEIIERTEIEDIIKRSQVCRLAVCKDNIPYIVPMCFGFDGSNIFVHTATKGRKNDFWEANPLVCFEFEVDVEIISHPEKACRWATDYLSVIGYGDICEILDEDEKLKAFDLIMAQYSDKSWEIKVPHLKSVKLWKIKIIDIKGKKSKHS